MLNAVDVANFFVNISIDDPYGCITNLALNKLVYFAQGWSLARNDKPLFEEDIQAWKFGPVVPTVYRSFQACGRERIASTVGNFDYDKYDPQTLQLLLDVFNAYGQYTASGLVKMTHQNGTPWETAYVDGQNNVITKKDLKSYFSQLTPLSNFDSGLLDEGFVGHRNENGILVLPREFDDQE